MEPKLAPLVSGRTYWKDFRQNLIAVPEDFGPDEIAAVRPYILALFGDIFSAARDRPTFVVFHHRHWTVTGVCCAADQVARIKIRDSSGAPVIDKVVENPNGRVPQVFLGWVSAGPSQTLVPKSMEFFAPLYQHVADRWAERTGDPGADDIHRVAYKVALSCRPAPDRPRLDLPAKANQVHVMSANDDPVLWESAQVGTESVCLGLAERYPGEARNNARAAPFGHVTILGNTKVEWVDRCEPRLGQPPSPLPKPKPDAVGRASQPLPPSKPSAGAWTTGSLPEPKALPKTNIFGSGQEVPPKLSTPVGQSKPSILVRFLNAVWDLLRAGGRLVRSAGMSLFRLCKAFCDSFRPNSTHQVNKPPEAQRKPGLPPMVPVAPAQPAPPPAAPYVGAWDQSAASPTPKAKPVKPLFGNGNDNKPKPPRSNNDNR